LFLRPIIWMLIPAFLHAIAKSIPGTPEILVGLLNIVNWIVGFWTFVMIVDTSWMLHEGKAPSKTLIDSVSWGTAGRVFDCFLVSVLYAIACLGGGLLLIVPGIACANWFGFAPLAMLIEGAHGTGALKRSKDLVDGRFWHILWRGIVIIALPLFIFFAFLFALGLVLAILTSALNLAMPPRILLNLFSIIVTAPFATYLYIANVIFFAEARKAR